MQEKQGENFTAPLVQTNPYQIELLETHIRFDNDGSSRKEVHTQVRINNEIGARQFAQIKFDYNRSFQNIEFPLVRITHSSGGTADILPSAISDQPNPAVVNAPAYQDVRVKSVRVLGLTPGDLLEYRIITTVAHYPLAPDFWLTHSFDHSGVVSREIFELDIPASRHPEICVNPAIPASSTDKSGEGASARTIYRWQQAATEPQSPPKDAQEDEPDIALSTEGWEPLSIRLDERLTFHTSPLEELGSYESSPERAYTSDIPPQITAKVLEITKGIQTNRGKLEAIYDFVSQKIATIDLPLGATGFFPRLPNDILASGYATAEDKFVLFASLAAGLKLHANAALTGYCDAKGAAQPLLFKHLLILVNDGKSDFWLDPSLEVAPFGLVAPSSGKCAFVLDRLFFGMNSTGHEWQPLVRTLPFSAMQDVQVDAALAPDGKLTAKVKYAMRGDSELLLRVTFHQTPRERWKGIAQLLSLSDGFRGKIASVSASDPYATKEPFTVEYEIVQEKFVDWSKKPVRIPAILPLLGLPDPPAKSDSDALAPSIELGTPLDVQMKATLHLPEGTTIHIPTAISVDRDYATFSSHYAAKENTITASRHINFLLRELPVARATDYNAFLHAVQSDQSQLFLLDRPNPPSP